MRWLAGECTAAEEAVIRDWLAADPRARTTVAALRKAMDLNHPVPEDWDSHAAWPRMADATGIVPPRAAPPRLAPPLSLVPETGGHRRWWTRSARGLQVAAAVLVAVGGTLLLEHTARRQVAPPAASAAREFSTARGQRLELRLADGTRVTLGPASRLAVPAAYGVAERRVRLDGEGYFDVVHDSTRPFAVRARYALARDLGTRFVVRAREGEPAVRVVVAEGQVALGATATPAHGAAVLTPGELARLDSAGVASVVRGVDLDRYLAWTRGRLVFDRTPLPEAIAELGRWYDVDMVLGAPALAAGEVTVTFENESLNQVLDAIAFVAHARYERAGRRVTFYPTR